jgi:O-antigen ligase
MGRYFEPYGKMHVTSHNMFLWVLLETGIVGLVLFLSVGYQIIKATRNLLKRGESVIGAVGIGMLLIIFIAGITGSTIGAYPVNLLFWALCGGLCAYSYRLERESANSHAA